MMQWLRGNDSIIVGKCVRDNFRGARGNNYRLYRKAKKEKNVLFDNVVNKFCKKNQIYCCVLKAPNSL